MGVHKTMVLGEAQANRGSEAEFVIFIGND